MGKHKRSRFVGRLRARKLAIMPGLSEGLIDDMVMGARLHDAFKEEEVMTIKAAQNQITSIMNAVDALSEGHESALQESGFSQRVIHLSQAAPFQSLTETAIILDNGYRIR